MTSAHTDKPVPWQGLGLAAALAALVAVTPAGIGCSDDGAGPGRDAGLDAADTGLDARADARPDVLADVDIQDAMPDGPQDAEPDAVPCAPPYPGDDPNATLIPGTGLGETRSYSVEGPWVVFSEYRDVPDSNYPRGGTYAYNLDTGDSTVVADPLVTSSVLIGAGDNLVAWNDFMNNGAAQYITDLRTGDTWPAADPQSGKEGGRAFNGWALASIWWTDDNSADDYYVVRFVETGELVRYANEGQDAEGEDMSDRYLSFVARPQPYAGKDVWYMDLQTRELFYLASTAQGGQNTTSTDGHWIVWEDSRDTTMNIYAYDIDSAQEMRLSNPAYDQWEATIKGNVVAWMDYQFSHSSLGCQAGDVYVYDLTTGQGRRVTANSWAWIPIGFASNGRLIVASSPYFPYRGVYRFWVFDLIAMGILDETGTHVLPP